MSDFEDLLRRYIWHIIDCESVDYLDHLPGHGSVEFTADEIATLRRLSAEYDERPANVSD